MKFVKGLFIFLLGASAGAAGAYYYTNKKLLLEFEERRDELLKYYDATMPEEVLEAKEKSNINLNKPDIKEYEVKVNKLNYTAFSTPTPIVEKVTREEKPSVELITVDDYGDGTYEVEEAILYGDDVVASDLEDEELDYKKYFGDVDVKGLLNDPELEDGDCIYVRNHELKLDICVNRNLQETFSEVIQRIYGDN